MPFAAFEDDQRNAIVAVKNNIVPKIGNDSTSDKENSFQYNTRVALSENAKETY